MNIQGNKQTEPGTYDIIISLKPNYAWTDGLTDEIIFEFTIKPSAPPCWQLNPLTTTYLYDGQSHTLPAFCPNATFISYMDEDGEYTLTDAPGYTELGQYVIKFSVIFGTEGNYEIAESEATLTIHALASLVGTYRINDTSQFISRIPVSTTETDFRSKFFNPLNSIGYFIEVDTKKVNGEQVMYTGGKTRVYRLRFGGGSDLYMEYTNAVTSDVNGDGQIGIIDYIRIRKDIMDLEKLSGVYYEAADVNDNDRIDIIDYIRIRKIIMEEEP